MKKNKKISLLFSLIQTVLIIALVVLAIASFGTRIPLLARLGFNFFAVKSGSMEPNIPAGSLILAGKYKLEDLKKDDIITYSHTNPETGEPSIVTHRITKVDKQEIEQPVNEGENKKITTYEIKTKGDANNEEDHYVLNPGNVIWLYKWHVPKLGYLTTFVQTPQGFIGLVILPAAILIIWEVVSLILYFKRHFENKAETEIARLKDELKRTAES